jgi:hypothetical protein
MLSRSAFVLITFLLIMTFTNIQAFKDLKDIIQGDIIIPSDAGYGDALKRWSKLAEKPAGAVVFVKSNKDVSAVIRFVVEQKVDLASKGE